jgi:hypothetical protein
MFRGARAGYEPDWLYGVLCRGMYIRSVTWSAATSRVVGRALDLCSENAAYTFKHCSKFQEIRSVRRPSCRIAAASRLKSGVAIFQLSARHELSTGMAVPAEGIPLATT